MRGANRQIKTMGAGAIVGSVLLFRQEELSDPTSVPAQGGYWVHTAITLPIMSTELNCTELYSLNHTTPPHKDYHHIPSSPIVCIDWQQQAATDINYWLDTSVSTFNCGLMVKGEPSGLLKLRGARPPQSQSGAIFCHLNYHCVVFESAR